MKKYSNIKSKFSAVVAASLLVACSPAKFEDLKQSDFQILPRASYMEFGAFLKLDGAQQEEIAKYYGFRCDGGILPPVLPGPVEPQPFPVETNPVSLPEGKNDRLTISTDNTGISFEEDYWNNRPRYCIPVCRFYRAGTGYAEPGRVGELSDDNQASQPTVVETENFVVPSENLGAYHRELFMEDDSLVIGRCEEIIEPPICTNCETSPRIPLPEPIVVPGPSPMEPVK